MTVNLLSFSITTFDKNSAIIINFKKNLKLFDSTLFKKDLIKIGVNKIDYLEIINQKSLEKPKKSNENFNIFIAYYLNKVRLIDNI